MTKLFVQNLCHAFESLGYTVNFLDFSDTGKLCCNLPKSKTKRPNLRVFYQIDANGIANSEDPDQTARRGAA